MTSVVTKSKYVLMILKLVLTKEMFRIRTLVVTKVKTELCYELESQLRRIRNMLRIEPQLLRIEIFDDLESQL